MSANDTDEAAKNIEKAQLLKEEGNAAFKNGEYQKAMSAYHQIFMYVHGYSASSAGPGAAKMPGQTTTPVSHEQMATIKELKLVHFNNLAMCHLKHGPNLQKAKMNCTKALDIDPKNVKALFRRGKCYAQLGEIDEAKEDFDRVLELQPDNKDAVRELRALKSQFAAQRKKEQKRFAGLFDKLQADAEEEEAAAKAAGAASSSGAPAATTTKDAPIADVSDPAAIGDPAASGGSGSSDRALENPAAGMAPAAESFDEDIGAPLGPPQPFEPHDVHVGNRPVAELGADPAK